MSAHFVVSEQSVGKVKYVAVGYWVSHGGQAYALTFDCVETAYQDLLPDFNRTGRSVATGGTRLRVAARRAT